MGFAGAALTGAELYFKGLSMATARIVKTIWLGYCVAIRNRLKAGGRED